MQSVTFGKLLRRRDASSEALAAFGATNDHQAALIAWHNYLESWKGFISVVEGYKKTGTSAQAWFDSIMDRVRKDDGLNYLYESRNFSEHEIGEPLEVVAGSISLFGGNPFWPQLDQESDICLKNLTFDEFGVASFEAKKPVFMWSEPTLILLKNIEYERKKRGKVELVSIKVPTSCMEQPLLRVGDPSELGGRGINFLGLLLGEATKYSGFFARKF